jgi:hypothetical protein
MQFKKANKLLAKANVQSPTLEDLAKYLGFLLGYEGKIGGWVYDGDKVVEQGWTAVGLKFISRGWIKKSPKLFINWNYIPRDVLA